MKVAYTRIKKPRRVTDDPVIYVCSPYAADPERNARRAENFCRYVWKMGGIPLAPHQLFTRYMNENRNKERAAGLRGHGRRERRGIGPLHPDLSLRRPHHPDHHPRRERPESLVVAYLTSRRKTQWLENA